MVELKQEFSKSASAERQQEFGEKNLNSLRALQGTLRDLGHGDVTLHYLMTDKRLWIATSSLHKLRILWTYIVTVHKIKTRVLIYAFP